MAAAIAVLCVQDSPESPCSCMHGDFDPVWWWVADTAVVRDGKSGRHDHDGTELQFFDLSVDAQIVMESTRPVSVAAVKSLGDTISAERVRGLASGSGPGGPDVIEESIPGWAFKALIEIAEYLKDNYLDEIVKPIQWPPPK